MQDRIAIVTTVLNDKLYQKSLKSYPEKLDYFKIDGRFGCYGIHAIELTLKKMSAYDFIVMVDEDVVFENNSELFSLVREMKQNQIEISGCRDFDMGGKRHDGNPLVMNTFFLLINNLVLKHRKSQCIFKNPPIFPNDFFEEKFLSQTTYRKENLYSLREPYYWFFLALWKDGANFLYLKNVQRYFFNDEVTTTVFGRNNLPICHHSWYARAYDINQIQKERIDDLMARFEFFKRRKYRLLKSPLTFVIRFYKKKSKQLAQKIFKID